MKIDRMTEAIIRDLWSRVEPRIREAKTLEEGAQTLATELYTQFAESVVLARVFVTAPFDALPADVCTFVENLVKSAGRPASLRGPVPVVSLVGTQGQEAAWNDRRNSRRHQGIPLISSSFVAAIPMIARLFRDLGVPLEWIDSDDAEHFATAVGHSAGLFFVRDAATAVDDHGRTIIAPDFVSTYGIKTVFGAGGAYARGQLLVIVIFCRDEVPRTTAERCLHLADLFKGQTASVVEAGRVFEAA